jgi:hypothetical protein
VERFRFGGIGVGCRMGSGGEQAAGRRWAIAGAIGRGLHCTCCFENYLDVEM